MTANTSSQRQRVYSESKRMLHWTGEPGGVSPRILLSGTDSVVLLAESRGLRRRARLHIYFRAPTLVDFPPRKLSFRGPEGLIRFRSQRFD